MRREKECQIYQELAAYKKQLSVVAEEEKIAEVIEISKEKFRLCEAEQSISYLEFLIGQFRIMRKRWWILQICMLGVVSVFLPYMQNEGNIVRTLGVIGVLFVVMIIPEFWKNKSYDCMQVEGTCLYSLRRIYAARIILFGMADLFILTCFFMNSTGKIGLAAEELFIQFLFPMLVAACICFGTLCSSTWVNEGATILLCFLWCAVWCFIITNEAVYAVVTIPAWGISFGCLALFLAGAVYKTINNCNKCWEVAYNGTANN